MKNCDLTDEQIGRLFRVFILGGIEVGTMGVRNPGLDLDLLHDQKLSLISVAEEEREAIREGGEYGAIHQERADALDGLVNFLDAFQDILVDNMGSWKFPEEHDTSAE